MMPNISVTESVIADNPSLVNLRIAGTLDVATLPHFESALARLRAAERFRVIVDLSALEYISSSGLGAFLGTVDHFRKAGGDLAFVRLTDKVQKIFKVVGFHRLLTILPDEAEAVRHFEKGAPALTQILIMAGTSTPHSGEPFDLEVIAADSRGMGVDSFEGEVALRPSTGIVSPAKIGPFVKGVWKGLVTLTGPGSVALRASHEDVAGEAAFDVREDRTPATLPFMLLCPGCGTESEIKAFNVYRCKACDEIYFVDKWAHAISLKAGNRAAIPLTKVVVVTLPADVNMLGALRGFLTTLLNEQGYPMDAVNDLELAADEAVTNVVEHAYQYDPRRALTLEMHMEPGIVKVLVKDQGEAFEPGRKTIDLDQHIADRKTGGLGVHLMHTIMDSVDYRREGDTNILTLVKKTADA